MSFFSVKKIKNIITFRDKLIRGLTDPYWLGGFLLRKISPLIRDDAKYIKWEYFFGMRKFPNLQNPTTYNEKLQWMKLYDRRPEYVRMVDKAEAKNYVREILGTDAYNIPTLGVWNSFDEIDFDSLPRQFVLKTTHDSGGVVIVKDKERMSYTQARKKLTKSLKYNYYLNHREWPYKHVKPRIIAEEFMENAEGGSLKDYKFFCFAGEPRMLFVATDRPFDTRFDFFDIQFNHLPFLQGHPSSTKKIEKPENFDEMVNLARLLSKGLSQVRVDLYEINGKIYFGELTLFSASGNVPFVPEVWDKKIGDLWNLQKN